MKFLHDEYSVMLTKLSLVYVTVLLRSRKVRTPRLMYSSFLVVSGSDFLLLNLHNVVEVACLLALVCPLLYVELQLSVDWFVAQHRLLLRLLVHEFYILSKRESVLLRPSISSSIR